MATPKYTALAEYTAVSADGSITFASIPATYRDLMLVISGAASNIVNVIVRLNGDSGTNYSSVIAEGNGTSGTSFSATDAVPEVGRMSTSESNTIIEIMDYSVTDKHTTILGRGNSNGDLVRMSATRWANTAAVTSVTILSLPSGRTFNTGTTICLYGVK